MKIKNIAVAIVLLVGVSLPSMTLQVASAAGSGRTFYVDFSSGSDSNAGTSQTAPWKRVPGMTGFTGSYTSQPGDTFIFKGGVTWTASYPWTFKSGASGAPIIYTTLSSWYNGSAFTRPVFDDGHADPGGVGMANTSGGS